MDLEDCGLDICRWSLEEETGCDAMASLGGRGGLELVDSLEGS